MWRPGYKRLHNAARPSFPKMSTSGIQTARQLFSSKQRQVLPMLNIAGGVPTTQVVLPERLPETEGDRMSTIRLLMPDREQEMVLQFDQPHVKWAFKMDKFGKVRGVLSLKDAEATELRGLHDFVCAHAQKHWGDNVVVRPCVEDENLVRFGWPTDKNREPKQLFVVDDKGEKVYTYERAITRMTTDDLRSVTATIRMWKRTEDGSRQVLGYYLTLERLEF